MRLFISLLLLSIATIAPVHAGAPADWRKALLDHLSYEEQFDRPKRGAFGGAIRPGTDGIWTVELGDGTLAYTNTTDSSAVRHAELYRARFGGIDWQTDGAEVSAKLTTTSTEGGAAGLLAGYPGSGDYLVFGIGGGSNYTILQKVAGTVSVLANGQDDAIRAGESNALSLERDGAHLSFVVNGTTVFEVTRDNISTAPVGLAVFGKGHFAFSNYRIVPALPILDQLISKAPACDFPVPGADDKLMILSTYDGAAASSVTTVGQDRETSVIDVAVAAGSEPLFVVAQASNPVIWRVHGAVERITRFETVSALGQQAGVVGVARERVGFHAPQGCTMAGDDKNATARAYVRSSLGFGRPVDLVVNEYSPASVELPSGTVATDIVAEGLPPRADTVELGDALRFTPAGLVRLDPDDVVAAVPVRRYGVLPQEWGLLQLLAEGAIIIDDLKHTPRSFRVTRAMRFPAGLTGAHAVTFLVPDNLPIPDGDPGHCKIIRVPAPSEPSGPAP